MKSMLSRGLCPTVISLCLCFSLPAIASDCRITGSITDFHSAAVATAVVTVTQVQTGSTHQVLSNVQGRFELASIPPGEYRIEAVKPGFKPLSHTGVALHPGTTATVDLQMQVGEVAETETLEAHKTADGSLLVYLCAPSPGSGCETLEPADPVYALDVFVVSVVAPCWEMF